MKAQNQYDFFAVVGSNIFYFIVSLICEQCNVIFVTLSQCKYLFHM